MVQIASTQHEENATGNGRYPPGSPEFVFLDFVRRYARYSLLWSQKAYVNRSIFLSLAFLRGYQDLYASRDHPNLQEIPLPRSKNFLTKNHIQRITRAIVGLLQEFRPQVIARPMEDTLEAEFAARMVTKLLRAYHSQLRLDDRWDEIIEWIVPVGNAFLTVAWNAMKGEDVVAVQPMPDGTIAARRMKSGDMDAATVSPLELYVPFAATEIEPLRCPWWARLHLISRQGGQRLYGKDILTIPATKGYPLYGQESWERKILQMGAGVSGKGMSFATADFESLGFGTDYVSLTQLHVFGATEDESGIHGVESGGHVLDVGPCHGDDIVHFGFLPQPGQFWFKGIVEDLLHPQREYNDAVRKRAEWRAKVHVPRVLAQDGMRFNVAKMTNGQGDVVTWSADGVSNATPPTWFEMPSPDEAWYRDIEIMLKDLDALASVNPTWSAGEIQKSLRSAEAIQLVQSATQRVHSPVLKGLQRSWVKVYEQILSHLKRHAIEDRKLPVGSGEEWVQFRSADLSRKVRIEVELIPASLTSRTIVQGHIDHLVQFQFLTPTNPSDRAIVLKGYDLPGSEMAIRTMTADVELQDREILKMIGDPLRGVPGVEVPINDNDVHQDHIRGLDLFRKSPQWDRVDPQAQARIIAHQQTHHRVLAEQIQLTQDLTSGVDEGAQGAVETSPTSAKG